jgi:tRNA (mo5U34)-methyltransferase
MDREEAFRLVTSVQHWHHKFELVPGVLTPGSYAPEFLWNMLEIGDATGKTAIDIGASDGYFSRQLVRAGATVTAVDYRSKDQTGFSVMQRAAGITVRHVHASIYDIPAAKLDAFDIVLCLGVLYHLPDLLRGLLIVRSVSKKTARVFFETEYDPAIEGSSARYCPGNKEKEGLTNFWFPSRLCVLDLLTDTGFTPLREKTWGTRLLIEAAAEGSTHKADLPYRKRSD